MARDGERISKVGAGRTVEKYSVTKFSRSFESSQQVQARAVTNCPYTLSEP